MSDIKNLREQYQRQGSLRLFTSLVSVDSQVYVSAAAQAITRGIPITEVLSRWVSIGKEIDFDRSIEIVQTGG